MTSPAPVLVARDNYRQQAKTARSLMRIALGYFRMGRIDQFNRVRSNAWWFLKWARRTRDWAEELGEKA